MAKSTRLICHLDISADDVERAIEVFGSVLR
jgi:threonine aldolase